MTRHPDGHPAGPGRGTRPGARAGHLELVRAACLADPDLPALIFEDGVSVSRARLLGRDRVVRRLPAVPRIEPGDRVAIMMPNRAEFMVAWLAVAACRGILVALNPAARSHDAGHVLRDSAATDRGRGRARTPRCSPNSSRTARTLAEIVVAARRRAGRAERLHRAPGMAGRPDEARGDLTNIFYTSGTTGPPKGLRRRSRLLGAVRRPDGRAVQHHRRATG